MGRVVRAFVLRKPRWCGVEVTMGWTSPFVQFRLVFCCAPLRFYNKESPFFALRRLVFNIKNTQLCAPLAF